MIEPKSVLDLRAALKAWDEDGQCPNTLEARHSCVWTCTECRSGMPPTVGSHEVFRDADGTIRYGELRTFKVRCSKKGGAWR